MAAYKLLALDMDGTTLTEDKRISEENKKWMGVAMDAGVTVMFATGRGRKSMAPYVMELELHNPIVSTNGSEVWERPDLLYKRHTLETEMVHRLHKMAVDNGTYYWAHAVGASFNINAWTHDINAEQWLLFGFDTDRADVLRDLHKEVASWGCFEISNSSPTNIELNPAGISKASGLRDICELKGISMNDVVAVGDSFNDLTMIRAAGLGVAMGNAQPAVKAEADWVTSTNEQDGVARVIREKILEL